MGRKVILDVDTGTDDAVAIMFAALHPDLDLIGVTTVNGNVPLGNTTDNTLRVLDWTGTPDIPVFAACHGPSHAPTFPHPNTTKATPTRTRTAARCPSHPRTAPTRTPGPSSTSSKHSGQPPSNSPWWPSAR